MADLPPLDTPSGALHSLAMHVTRIAPSPTGMMHLGTARTALFNWLAARPSGKFILRIDDTDAARNQPETVQPILDGLAWLGLNFDHTARQSDRLDLYRAKAENLLEHSYATRAENGAVLLRWNDLDALRWNDRVAGDRAATERDAEMIDGLVLMRGDGAPTYHFASTVDDMDMGVTLIIRGADHQANTGKQVAIWTALERSNGGARPFPETAHVGLISQNGKKMSKRDGAASLLDYRDRGIDPDAMFNFLLRLGWGPRVDDRSTAVLSRDQAVALFLDGGRMRAAPANFDEAKLLALDRKIKAQKKAGL